MQDIEMMKRYGRLPEGFDDWEEDDLEEGIDRKNVLKQPN